MDDCRDAKGVESKGGVEEVCCRGQRGFWVLGGVAPSWCDMPTVRGRRGGWKTTRCFLLFPDACRLEAEANSLNGNSVPCQVNVRSQSHLALQVGCLALTCALLQL